MITIRFEFVFLSFARCFAHKSRERTGEKEFSFGVALFVFFSSPSGFCAQYQTTTHFINDDEIRYVDDEGAKRVWMHEIAYSSKMGRNQKCVAAKHGDEEEKKNQKQQWVSNGIRDG